MSQFDLQRHGGLVGKLTEDLFTVPIGAETIVLQNDTENQTTSADKDDSLRWHAPEMAILEVPPHRDHPYPIVLVGTRNSSLLDGLDRSHYLRVVEFRMWQDGKSVVAWKEEQAKDSSTQRPPLYVVDFASIGRDCHIVSRMISMNETNHLVYVDTSSSTRTIACFPYPGRWFAKESIVKNRYWNHTAQWVERGERIDNQNILHFPRFLRESFVEKLAENLVAFEQDFAHLSALDRSMHVSSFWQKGRVLPYAFLRDHVNNILLDLQESRPGMKLTVRAFGSTDDMDQNLVETRYILAAMSTQVIVIAQHDEWEGHYRLLESMASGALVLSDKMVAPLPGLENNTNIVFYDDEETLKSLLIYYLHPKNEKLRKLIAQRGVEYALGTQRGYHAVERLLYGRPLTNVETPYAEAPKRNHLL